MYIHVEVVDAPLDYNILLGRNLFYVIQEVDSSVFRLVQFSFQGNIVTVDKLEFCSLDMSSNSTNNVLLLCSSS